MGFEKLFPPFVVNTSFQHLLVGVRALDMTTSEHFI